MYMQGSSNNASMHRVVCNNNESRDGAKYFGTCT